MRYELLRRMRDEDRPEIHVRGRPGPAHLPPRVRAGEDSGITTGCARPTDSVAATASDRPWVFSYHARVRAQQRYGLELTDEDDEWIIQQIREGRAIKLGQKGAKTSVYLVTCQNIDAVVVYSRAAKSVISFLPLDWEIRGAT